MISRAFSRLASILMRSHRPMVVHPDVMTDQLGVGMGVALRARPQPRDTLVVEVAAARRPRGRERHFIGHNLLCANVWSNKTGFMMLTYLRSPQLRYMT
jgi:hypothetical protein